jgi:hypothetical protein
MGLLLLLIGIGFAKAEVVLWIVEIPSADVREDETKIFTEFLIRELSKQNSIRVNEKSSMDGSLLSCDDDSCITASDFSGINGFIVTTRLIRDNKNLIGRFRFVSIEDKTILSTVTKSSAGDVIGLIQKIPAIVKELNINQNNSAFMDSNKKHSNPEEQSAIKYFKSADSSASDDTGGGRLSSSTANTKYTTNNEDGHSSYFYKTNPKKRASFRWRDPVYSGGQITCGAIGGIWKPEDNLAIIGNHPTIGVFIGGRGENINIDVSMQFKFLDSKNPYFVKEEDSLYRIKHFFGGYIGLDGRFFILNITGNEVDLIGGIAYDGWDALQQAESASGTAKGINSLNLNVGIGYRHNSSTEGITYFWGPEIRYNFVRYDKDNIGGTDLSGNVITILFSIGFGATLN